MSVTVPVLKSCEIAGRPYERGDLVTLEPIEAAALAYQGLVTLAVGTDLPAPPRRKRYARKDVRAEP